MKRISFGPLAIPALGTAYALYMMYEQLSGSGYRASTINYALVLGSFIVLSSLYVAFTTLRTPPSQDAAPAAPQDAERVTIISYPRRIAILLIVALMIYLFEEVGYAAAFFIIMLSSLLLLNVKSLKVLFGVPVGIVLIVHFVFVKLFDLSLPPGLLKLLG